VLVNSSPRASETLYFQNAAGKLFYHPAGYVRMAWSAERLPLDVLQAYYEQALKLLRTLGAHKILSDHGGRAPLLAAAQVWLTEDWIPRAIREVGFNYCAIVDGMDPMHRLSTQSVVSAAPAALTFKRYASVADAEAWLKNMR
jgi:hypothetical protein